jgi:hypothetical protein
MVQRTSDQSTTDAVEQLAGRFDPSAVDETLRRARIRIVVGHEPPSTCASAREARWSCRSPRQRCPTL